MYTEKLPILTDPDFPEWPVPQMDILKVNFLKRI